MAWYNKKRITASIGLYGFVRSILIYVIRDRDIKKSPGQYVLRTIRSIIPFLTVLLVKSVEAHMSVTHGGDCLWPCGQ